MDNNLSNYKTIFSHILVLVEIYAIFFLSLRLLVLFRNTLGVKLDQRLRLRTSICLAICFKERLSACGVTVMSVFVWMIDYHHLLRCILTIIS